MKDFLNRLERRVGGRAIPHLTAVMIGCFVVGYILQAMNPNAAAYMNLNVAEILRGQVWRLVTWIIVPPSQMDIFTLIMLFFYFSIGSALERSWGDFRYNVYIIGGILISIIAAFLSFFIFRAIDMREAGALSGILASQVSSHVGSFTGSLFTTVNICTSLMLAFAATFPDATVLLMFVIPIKMKYLGYLYGAFIIYDGIGYVRLAISMNHGCYLIGLIAIAAAMLNFVLFFMMTRSGMRPTRAQKKRQREFQDAFAARSTSREVNMRPDAKEQVIRIRPYRHRCEICGRTDQSDPDLEFRYCSRCSGDHEYCMDHLYTHQHITTETK